MEKKSAPSHPKANELTFFSLFSMWEHFGAPTLAQQSENQVA